MTTDSTILLNQNKNLADLLTERKIDFTKDDIKIKSLNINEESIVSDTKEVLEIDLGNIKSIPTTKNFIKEKDLEALDNLNEYDYTVSLIGRKLEEDENFHTRNYCQYQTY